VGWSITFEILAEFAVLAGLAVLAELATHQRSRPEEAESLFLIPFAG